MYITNTNICQEIFVKVSVWHHNIESAEFNQNYIKSASIFNFVVDQSGYKVALQCSVNLQTVTRVHVCTRKKLWTDVLLTFADF